LDLFKESQYLKGSGLIFILLSLLYVVISIIINEFIISVELYYNTYSDQLNIDRINTLIRLKEKWEWPGYVFIPLILVVKLLLITLSIEIGAIILDYKIRFNEIFRVVLIAEMVMIISQVIRTISLFFMDFKTLDDIHNFYPLSILNLLNAEDYDAWLIYPLKLANVFTAVYFIVMAYGLSFILRKKLSEMLLFTISTYGLCLVIWIMLIMFIYIYFS
jgi:hypothetical protein